MLPILSSQGKHTDCNNNIIYVASYFLIGRCMLLHLYEHEGN